MQTQRHEVSMYSWKNGVDKVPRHRIATNLQCGKTTVKWSVVRQGMPGYIQYLGSCWGISASNVFHSQVWPVKSYTQESSCSLSFLGLMKVTLEGKNPAYGRPIRWKKPRSCVSFGPLGAYAKKALEVQGIYGGNASEGSKGRGGWTGMENLQMKLPVWHLWKREFWKEIGQEVLSSSLAPHLARKMQTQEGCGGTDNPGYKVAAEFLKISSVVTWENVLVEWISPQTSYNCSFLSQS